MARRLCAPREVLVQRLTKREDSGLEVVLFSSIEDSGSPAKPRSGLRTRQQSGSACAEGAGVPDAVVRGAATRWLAMVWAWLVAWAGALAAVGRWAWSEPVRAQVHGGYTISPREGCEGSSQPECLVTCILKVGRLGGGAVGRVPPAGVAEV